MKLFDKNGIDMCEGPLFGKIILFSVPLMLTNILQLLYNAADIVVIGAFRGTIQVAAVGATSSFIALIVNVFMGLSVGVSVAENSTRATARCRSGRRMGAGSRHTSRTVTSSPTAST